MLQPIQIGHELICPCGCGTVVGNIEELPTEKYENLKTKPSIDIYLLGTAMQKNVAYSKHKSPTQVYEENVLRNLRNIIHKFNLPDKFIYETFNQMKRNRKGFRSEYEYIKQLIKILSRDENYEQIHKLRKLKAWYEKFSNM